MTDLIHALRTNGAVRAFRPDPVPADVLYRVLDTARFAPSGGNKQPWGVIVVRDRAKRIALRQLAQLGFADYAAHEKAGIRAFAPGLDGIWHGPAIDLDEARRTPGVWPFVDHLEDVPELLLITVDLTLLAIMDNPLDRQSIVGGASTYPFVAHLLLAARGEGLAGVMTTFVIREEPEARKILGFPDHVALAAMVALGYPEHQNSKLTRKPVEEFARIDSWDGPPLTA